MLSLMIQEGILLKSFIRKAMKGMTISSPGCIFEAEHSPARYKDHKVSG